MSAWPASKGPSALAIGCSTYWISENPSSRSNSSARYWGDRQIAGACTRRIFFTSGGGSAVADRGYRPSSPAVPASVPPRNLRRLNGLACCVHMGTSFPESGQWDPKNVGHGTLLPSSKQVQHLAIDYQAWVRPSVVSPWPPGRLGP